MWEKTTRQSMAQTDKAYDLAIDAIEIAEKSTKIAEKSTKKTDKAIEIAKKSNTSIWKKIF
jgi:hypothetical protein